VFLAVRERVKICPSVRVKPPFPPNPATHMKSSFVFFRLCAVLALVFPLALAAQPAVGVIEGRVFNAATGSALVNARISLEGSDREVTTDESGSYRLTGVPGGPARLSVVYVGMAPQTAAVNVPAGGAVQREFELVLAGNSRLPATNVGETVKLEAFSVVADREMSAQAVAMNEQRNAPNLKNVVALDEFGDRGSENIGEFLLFLPGVSIATSGSEPTTVSPYAVSPAPIPGSRSTAARWPRPSGATAARSICARCR
jgi:iron complex outermembrane receptor protein